MKTLIISPTYNERKNVAQIIHEVFSHNPDHHMLIVDDSSPDNTGDIVRHIASQYNWPINVISRSAKLGLGTAYKEGFEFARIIGSIDFESQKFIKWLSKYN